MILSRILHAFLALALLLAPSAMIGGSAAIAMPHHSSAMAADHCAEIAQQASSEEKSDEQGNTGIDCMISCSAIPAPAPFLPQQIVALGSAPVALSAALQTGTRPEAETPPPRRFS